MSRVQKRLLDALLDAYEHSKTYQGENKVNQSFSVRVGKLFPRYNDEAAYSFFVEVNEGLGELAEEGLISLERARSGVLLRASLRLDALSACYRRAGRVPRREEQEGLLKVIDSFEAQCRKDGRSELQPLLKYLLASRERVRENKNVEGYKQELGLGDYQDLLRLTRAVLVNEEEIFIRNLSVSFFADSKRIEKGLKKRAESLLFKYGDFEEPDTILEECGVVNTPTYVSMKGSAILHFGAQELDLSRLGGDISLSTESLKDLSMVKVCGSRVITVENLTTFHSMRAAGDFLVFLGGFHGKVKRDFLTALFAHNPDKEYRHFGDIDAGGFYILEHLKRRTGIPFRSIYMDLDTLKENTRRPLENNDRKRMQRLYQELDEKAEEGELLEDYRPVLKYMLDHNCKLEQESL